MNAKRQASRSKDIPLRGYLLYSQIEECRLIAREMQIELAKLQAEADKAQADLEELLASIYRRESLGKNDSN
ncbi:MAG TPA: hypothetical protein VNX68_13745 [Nitrosopumilaceae archaeon]|jgi:hypothetical protein|nr:hypothetical protein [Nitrosopumilaceae archaeon]